MNDVTKEKTVPLTSVGADVGQSNQKHINNIIPDGEENINSFEEKFAQMQRELRKSMDPSYMKTVTMSELYETAYLSKPAIIEGILYPGTYLFVGAPKVGKSTFCSQFDAPLFLDSESGLRSLSVYAVSIGDWDTLIEVYKELSVAKKTGKLPYKTLVFDTIDNFYSMCLDYICKKNSIKHPSDLEYGKGWNMVKVEFLSALTRFKALGLGIVYVAHASEKEIKSRTGTYTRYDALIAGQAFNIITSSCDFILYACIDTTPEGEKRILHTKPCEYWNAGDKTGKLPAEIPLDANIFLEEYKKAIGDEKK